MKSLILKDIYNICHEMKFLFFFLLIFAFAFIPTVGSGYYIFISVFICGTMVISTFTFDKQSNWNQYAMVMPVSKKDMVVEKYLLLLILSAVGAVFGWMTSTVGGMIVGKGTYNPADIGEMLSLSGAAFGVMLVMGSIYIPFLYKLGPERGRMIMILSCFFPVVISFVAPKLQDMLGITVTEQMVRYFLWASPLLVPVLCYWMYRISYRIFSKQEF